MIARIIPVLKLFVYHTDKLCCTHNPHQGMSYKGLAISEKHSDVKFSVESRRGIPFNFLMRDVLQFDDSLYDAMR